jgi:hypothetical protein
MTIPKRNYNIIQPAALADVGDCWLELVADPELLDLAFACVARRGSISRPAQIFGLSANAGLNFARS